MPTIRHRSCELILPGNLYGKTCTACEHYRKVLRALDSRAKKNSHQQLDPSSHINYRYLKGPAKNKRMKELYKRNRATKKCIARLKKKIDRITRESGVNLDQHMTGDIISIVQKHHDQVISKHPCGSFLHTFWNQQLQAAKRNQNGMRWHPLMIRWCIYLRHKSSGAYNLLRESGVVALPSQRTLRDYTYYIKTTTGFSDEVDEELMEAACAYVYFIIDTIN